MGEDTGEEKKLRGRSCGVLRGYLLGADTGIVHAGDDGFISSPTHASNES